MNLNSAPHEIQRIAPRAIQPMAAHHTVARGSVGGRELGWPNENLSVFQHRVAMSNTLLLMEVVKLGGQRITEHTMTYRELTIGRTYKQV